ncbi:hypothetical protein CJ195_13135 [Bacillus sp. UMB0899]|uniref:hypothetical protein n=1 Tax=Metabacillus schmidteae TaxID=2730405 RepID=UPI000C810033|nr:hypothetical protein [Metabacillus schmidteae]PMC36997.1 hypothetical protein CJ195_13135 [Bacillus sp. UMB0899]
MLNNEKPELFTLLKKLGFQLESKINKYIQDQLNKEEIALTANSAGHVLAHLIEAIHDYVEQLSSQLNFPTKKDIGRLGKLIVQSEDKIDNVEEELHEVLSLIKELKTTILKDVKSKAAPLEGLEDKIRQELRELLKNPTSHVHQQLEGLENSIKKRVLTRKKSLLAKKKRSLSKANKIKEELHRELMKPPGQADLKEVNNKLLQILKEKQAKKWGN